MKNLVCVLVVALVFPCLVMADSYVERLEKHRSTPFFKQAKKVVEGTIHHVDAYNNVPIGGHAGYMTVKRTDGTLLRFKMYTYSLILICNKNGCYAGRLNQLKLGWPASAAYITEEEGGVSPEPTPGPDGIDEVLCDNVLIRLEPEE